MRHLTSLRTRTPLLRLCGACLLLLTTLSFARAQDLDEVTISGRVMDERGAVLPGATVTATLSETRGARTVVTDAEGRYRLVELAPGAYTLRAESAGFAAGERRGVATVAGQTVRLDFTLRPARRRDSLERFRIACTGQYRERVWWRERPARYRSRYCPRVTRTLIHKPL